jgi:F-type H+-transporting ATPase subunit b
MANASVIAANPDTQGLDGGSAEVAYNLSEADKLQKMPHEGGKALTAAEGGHHADPALFGVLNGTVWVSIAMLVFIVIVVAKGGVKAIVGGLDKQIAAIRAQLAEAKTLRAEAEALRDEYARKIADAEKTAADMVGQAEHEAGLIVEQAKADAAELVRRRGKMAEDKIGAAERSALAEVRARAADAAARAASTLVAARLGAEGDRALVDRTIAGLGRLN